MKKRKKRKMLRFVVELKASKRKKRAGQEEVEREKRKRRTGECVVEETGWHGEKTKSASNRGQYTERKVLGLNKPGHEEQQPKQRVERRRKSQKKMLTI